MEEILASIRRIISDDTPPASPPPAAAKPAPQPEPEPERISEDDLDKLFSQDDEEILELDESVAEPDDVLDLTEDFSAEDNLGIVEGLMPDEADVAFAAEDEEPDLSGMDMDFDEPEPEPEPEPVPMPPPRLPPRMIDPEPIAREAERLVSAGTSASVSASFGSLNHTILSQNAKTLDDLVTEMLRPMLKNWLDENLPVIVERLVRAEIERVSRSR